MRHPDYAKFKAALLGEPVAPVKPVVDVDEEPWIDPEVLREANARHDREHGHPFDFERGKIKSSWMAGGRRGR